MKINNKSSALIVGMALFAMFFGSGNLIYPFFIGKIAQGAWLSVTLGFLIAAVLLPFLGVIAMVLYKGNYADFFSCLGRRRGILISAVLLTVWVPLGSAPRCMTLAYASIASYSSSAPPLWLFSLCYSVFIYYIITKKLGVLNILGRLITPLLLTCIGILCYEGFKKMPADMMTNPIDSSYFLKGLLEGYNTMDLIASFFFSASVIHILNQSGSSMGKTISLVLRSSVIGMLILALVYVCLIFLSAHHSSILDGIPKDQLFAYLAQSILGSTWSIVAIIAIILACFSTSIALIIVYTDFLHDEVFKRNGHPMIPIIVALVVTFVMSLFGLQGITFVTAPVLKVFYPVLLGLIVFNIGRVALKRKKRDVAAHELLSSE